jgi:hypothetical protein
MDLSNLLKRKDDIFTIELNDSDLIFTRYLYVKDEVRIALLVSILNKSEDAIFWAYELYYSGFQKDTIAILLDIYTKRFSKNHPRLGLYIKKKLADTKDETIATIVKNLTLKRIEENSASSDTIIPEKFVNIKAYHIDSFKTLDTHDIKYKWKYLQTACKYAVCKERLNKSDSDARLNMFRYNWLYECSLSPIWRDRIITAGGKIENETVVFDSEETEEGSRPNKHLEIRTDRARDAAML